MANRDFSRPFAGAEQELAFSGSVARGARGRAARRVQEWLVLHGITVAIDDDFGAKTEAGVRRFQAAPGLTATGVVDAATWEALTAPLREALAPIDPAGRTLRELVCLYARQCVAQHPREVGGPNDGPWVRAFMLGNGGKIWQWCAGFACFVLAQACAAKGVPLPFAPSFGVPQVARAAKARGRFSADGPAAPGDLFVIPSATSWSHIGVVLEWRGARFLSAEGNTNPEGSFDGAVAREVVRTVARCDFLRTEPS